MPPCPLSRKDPVLRRILFAGWYRGDFLPPRLLARGAGGVHPWAPESRLSSEPEFNAERERTGKAMSGMTVPTPLRTPMRRSVPLGFPRAPR